MSQSSTAFGFSANRTSENLSPKRNDLQWIDAMLDVAKRIWPTKTAWHLASQTHVSERAAQFWLAGQTGMTLAAARELMRGPHGFEFLVAYVGDDCNALWFERCKLAHEVGVTSRKLRAEEKRFETLKLKQQQLLLKLDNQ